MTHKSGLISHYRFLRKAFVYNALGGALLVLWGLALWQYSGTTADINEQCYLTACWLVRQGLTPWLDFAFVQMPLMPLVYGKAIAALGVQQGALGWAKLFTVLTAVGSQLLLWRLAGRLAHCRRVALAVLVLALASKNLFRIGWEVANYSPGNLLWLLALYALVRALPILVPGGVGISARLSATQKPAISFGWWLVSGLAFGLAISTKLYFLASWVPALGVAWWAGVRLWRPYAGWLLAFVVGLSPALILAAMDPFAAVWNNLGYHYLYNGQLMEGQSRVARLAHTLGYMVGNHLGHLPHAIAVGTGIGLLLAAWRRWSLAVVLLLVTLLGHVVLLLAMGVFYQQYFALITPLVLLLPAALYRQAWVWQQFYAKNILMLGAIAATIMLALQRGPNLLAFARGEYTPLGKPGPTAQRLLNIIPMDDRRQPAATLLPGIVVDAGLPVYRELATGPFAYQVADRLPIETRERLHIIGPLRLTEMFRDNPPGAVLVGWEFPDPSLNEPLRKYALLSDYKKVVIPAVEHSDTIFVFRKPHPPSHYRPWLLTE